MPRATNCPDCRGPLEGAGYCNACGQADFGTCDRCHESASISDIKGLNTCERCEREVCEACVSDDRALCRVCVRLRGCGRECEPMRREVLRLEDVRR